MQTGAVVALSQLKIKLFPENQHSSISNWHFSCQFIIGPWLFVPISGSSPSRGGMRQLLCVLQRECHSFFKHASVSNYYQLSRNRDNLNFLKNPISPVSKPEPQRTR